MGKAPSFKIKIPSVDEELKYIKGELLPKYSFYIKAGYKPKLPKGFTITKFNSKAKPSVNKLRSIILKSYDRNYYERAKHKIYPSMQKIWPRLITTLTELNNKIEIKIFSEYEIRLTKFGTGGDYFPSFGTFDGQFRSAPGKDKSLKRDRAIILLKLDGQNLFFRDPLEIIIHEIIHLCVEKSIVKRFGLTHIAKERLVDNICLLELNKLIPHYEVQDIKEANTDISKESPKRIPKSIKKYLNN